MGSVGWKVHGWSYPIVWWARRKPRSMFRQWVWSLADNIEWRRTIRRYRRAKHADNQTGPR
jgi:hypothetical protein